MYILIYIRLQLKKSTDQIIRKCYALLIRGPQIQTLSGPPIHLSLTPFLQDAAESMAVYVHSRSAHFRENQR